MSNSRISITKFVGILAIAGVIVNPQTVLSKTITADTVASSLLCKDSISYVIHQDTLKTKFIHPVIGPIVIGSTDSIIREQLKFRDTLPFPAGSFDSTFNVPMSGIHEVVFYTTSPPCTVRVRNLSVNTVYNLTLTIFDSVRSIAMLGPNDSVNLLFPVVYNSGGITYGRAFGDSIGMPFQVRMHQDSTSPGGGSIAVEVNLNGLVAVEAKILNHYISFSKSFICPNWVSDTFDIHYLDISNGLFRYGIYNYTDLKLQASVSQLNLWNTSFCASHLPPLESAENLSTETTNSDSLNYYMGRNVAVLQVSPHNFDSNTNVVNLSGDRLFPVWDSVWWSGGDYASEIPEEYLLTPAAEAADRIVDVRMTDSLLFSITAPQFKFSKMLATVMKRVVLESDTLKCKVPSPWNASSKDSLGKNVWADISTTFGLPDTPAYQYPAFIDTIGEQYTLFSPDSPAVSVAYSTKFTNIVNNKSFSHEINITNLMDLWRDSIYIAARVNIPVGTRMLWVNETPVTPEDTFLYYRYMGHMNISRKTAVKIYELTGIVDRDIKKPFNRFDVKYANDMLLFTIPESFAGPTEMSVFSLSGRCVKKVLCSDKGKIALPLGRTVARGMYSVFISNRNGTCGKKIFIW